MSIYSKYIKHLVAVDCIIFGYDITEKEVRLLLVKRRFSPSKGKWSLAGGFVEKTESLDEAARRILTQLTGLNDVYPEQSYSYGDAMRDPGARVISVAYSALIRINEMNKQLTERNEAKWISISNMPDLIFDHSEMVRRALSELQDQIKVKPVGFELLPDKFTLVQLQDLYEALFRRKVDRRNFRKKILSMGILERLDEKEKQTSKRGAFYYRFIKTRYEKLKENGFYFNPETI
jgi:ADP-ribose pyrophosphatase YjhB (NUDIX family)